jgi:hypothetical protein
VLEIEPTAKGLLFTMPASYPDGWQVVLELSHMTPKGVRLSDRGKTLSWSWPARGKTSTRMR